MLDLILESLRLMKGFPIRPSLQQTVWSDALHYRRAPDAPSSLGYCWLWLGLSVPWTMPKSRDRHRYFYVPVARVDEHRDNYSHVLSLSVLWHLLPTKTPVGQFFADTNQKLWELLDDLAVTKQHFIPSSHSLKKQGKQVFNCGLMSLKHRFDIMLQKYTALKGSVPMFIVSIW
jgi:hypothetical protein